MHKNSDNKGVIILTTDDSLIVQWDGTSEHFRTRSQYLELDEYYSVFSVNDRVVSSFTGVRGEVVEKGTNGEICIKWDSWSVTTRFSLELQGFIKLDKELV
jgi:hypothetical protein